MWKRRGKLIAIDVIETEEHSGCRLHCRLSTRHRRRVESGHDLTDWISNYYSLIYWCRESNEH